MKQLTDEEMKKGISNYNALVTYSVRYALGRPTMAPCTMSRIVLESCDILHEQTKQGIIRDIEDYIEQNEEIPDKAIWEELVKQLQKDIIRRRLRE